MVIKNPDDIPERRVTDEGTYLNRREFLRGGILAASVLATGYTYRRLNHVGAGAPPGKKLDIIATTTQPTTLPTNITSAFRTNETLTPLQSITHYNNFYEFSTDKEEVAEAAASFIAKPWAISVGGLVSNPRNFDLDDLAKLAPPEERIYRMHCVEAWSMVIPWAGFSPFKLLDNVRPLSSAKYVAFETLLDPKRMPNQNRRVLDWPYVEGLRMDEAMHPLTILATGLYGRELPPQDGAPVRLVVPWKYGFKGIKSIVKITLTESQPPATWNIAAPSEYGFYSNVNPDVRHPRWSQAMERRLTDKGVSLQPTLPFNGYADQVASLYTGMDLRQYF